MRTGKFIRSLIALLLVTGIVILVSCSKDEDKNPAGPGPDTTLNWFPLALGLIHHWANTTYDSLGNVTDTWTWADTLQRTREFNGETWYLDYFYDDTHPNDTVGVIRRSNGVFARNFTHPREVIIFPIPPTAGATWVGDFLALPSRWGLLNQTVTVEGRTYTNAAQHLWGPKWDAAQDSTYYELWYAPDYGWIQMLHWKDFQPGGAAQHMVRKDFHGRLTGLDIP